MYIVHKSQTCDYQKKIKSVMEKDSNDIKQADLQQAVKQAVQEAVSVPSVPMVTLPASVNTAMEIINSPGVFARVIITYLSLYIVIQFSSI